MTQAHPSATQRRMLTAAGGAGVLALAGGAFVLSFDTLRALAVQGGASRDRAYLYPCMLDGLVVVVILSILMSRRFRWWSRAVRWLLLLALVAGAGAAGVQHAVEGYGHLPRTWLSGGVAAAPWAILMIALWLWVSMIKQARRTRGDAPRPETATGTGLAPQLPAEPPPLALPQPVRATGEPLDGRLPPALPGPAQTADEAPDQPRPTPREPVRTAGEAPDEAVSAAPTLLPTDVAVAGGSLSDTRPDGVKPPGTRPGGVPLLDSGGDGATEPPAGTFRSSPRSPRE